jgi:transposase
MEQASVNPPKRCVGLDLGDRSSAYCLIDEGKILREGSVETSHQGLCQMFESLPPIRIVMEATRNTHWVRKLLKALGHEVIVANPRRLDLITKSSRKTDRNDARMLARLGRLDVDLLSPVYERSDESLQARLFVRSRAQLVRMRTKLVNQVRGSVKIFGHAMPSCSTPNFHVRARAAIPEPLRAALLPLLDVLAKLKETIAHYEDEIERLSQEHPQTAILRQIHGVGPLAALTFVLAIEDPKRFQQGRSVGAYLGLTPSSRQSGASDPKLRITKEGDADLRSLLVTAAMHILRRSAPDTDLKRYGRRIAASGTPRDKGRARVAVARKLAVLMHRLWLTGEVYQPLRSGTAAV